MASLGTNIDTLTSNCVLVEGDVASIQYIRHFRFGTWLPLIKLQFPLNSLRILSEPNPSAAVPKNLRRVAAM
jgi:hypothetical protein